MCGRFVSASTPERIAAHFGAETSLESLGENYNVAPTNDIYAVITNRDGLREIQAFHWGLIPSWAKDRKIGQRMINARAETIVEKPAFKGVFKKYRCIIPMDGFYEWAAGVEGGPVTKQGKLAKRPHFIHRSDDEPLAVAGLWSMWRDREVGPDEPWLHSATIITTSANNTMAPIHDRMPALLPKAMWEMWLDPTNDHVEILSQLLVPAPENLLTMHQVSTKVNIVRNRGTELVEPADDAVDQTLL